MDRSSAEAWQNRKLTEAAIWLARLTSGSATRQQLDRHLLWLARSPAHRTAWRRVQHIWLSLEAARERHSQQGEKKSWLGGAADSSG